MSFPKRWGSDYSSLEEQDLQLAGNASISIPPSNWVIFFLKSSGSPGGKRPRAGHVCPPMLIVLKELSVKPSLGGRGLELSHFEQTQIHLHRRPAQADPSPDRAAPHLLQPDRHGDRTARAAANPNLQNIPIRTEEGRRIRQAFIPEPGWMMLSADYSQIELRILAHYSRGRDPGRSLSGRSGYPYAGRPPIVFGVFPEKVDAEMRRQAKVINFGILYGMSAFGLSKELGISNREARP